MAGAWVREQRAFVAGDDVTVARRGPRSANERLRRLLVMLPWIMERGEVPVREVAERFDTTESAVIADLERASMCGLPPFEPGDLIDLFVDDGVVYAGPPKFFTRPLRLTAPEGFALLVAGRAAMQLPGADPHGPLARALDKLAEGLGSAGLEVDLPRPAAADELAAAVEAGAQLRIAHWSESRDETTERVIDPLAVFTDRGYWYVIADDHRSGEERTFRIDRVESIERTGATFAAAQREPAHERRVVLRRSSPAGDVAAGARGALGGGALSGRCGDGARRWWRRGGAPGDERRMVGPAAGAGRQLGDRGGAGRPQGSRSGRGGACARPLPIFGLTGSVHDGGRGTPPVGSATAWSSSPRRASNSVSSPTVVTPASASRWGSRLAVASASARAS